MSPTIVKCKNIKYKISDRLNRLIIISYMIIYFYNSVSMDMSYLGFHFSNYSSKWIIRDTRELLIIDR